MGLQEREKGKRRERECAAAFVQAGWPLARRGQQYSGAPGSPDVVVPGSGLHVEVKGRQHGAPQPWVSRARAEAPDGALPIVVWYRDRSRPVVVIDFDDFLRLWRRER